MTQADYPELRARPITQQVATRVPFRFIHINKCAGSSIEIALGLQKTHVTAADVRNHVGADAWDRMFTFSVVRHPIDRVVSIYHYRAAQDALGADPPTLDAWIEAVFQRRDPAFLDETLMFAPFEQWLCADGAVLVDYVARVEAMEEGWRHICGTLSIDLPLGRFNANRYPDWRGQLGRSALATLTDAFRDDFERYQYDT
ncbi:MAG: sulfotransferase family 2 domain-containing protein [Pseudomonadota bacterium]